MPTPPPLLPFAKVFNYALSRSELSSCAYSRTLPSGGRAAPLMSFASSWREVRGPVTRPVETARIGQLWATLAHYGHLDLEAGAGWGGGGSLVHHPWLYIVHCVVRQCCIMHRAGLSPRGARHRRHGVLVRHLLLKRTPLMSLSGRRLICRAPMPAGRSYLADWAALVSVCLSAGRVRQVMCGRVSQGRLGVMARRSTQFQRDAAAASRSLALVYPAQGFAGSGGSDDSSGSSWSGGGIGSSSGGESGISDGSSSGVGGGGGGGDCGDGCGSSWGSGAGAGVGSGWSDGGGWSSGAYEAEAAHGAHSAAVESDGRPWRAGGEPCGWTKRRRGGAKGPPRPLSSARA